ncbi:MAG: tetratricopeptide repeat protein [Flavobacteriaceae bacterium]|nr:tetratricopeptide repeat protein [Flavobacteriaceae bacterium]
MNRYIKIAIPLVGLLLLFGCSTRKNAYLNRGFHSFTAKYNVLYNGQLAFEDGIKQLNDNYSDNYWEVLPIEPLKIDELAIPEMSVSIDNSLDAFTKAEEKAVKAIQKHSMNFYNKERNPQIDDAYLLLGKSRYYSQRFVPALEAFNYVIKNYPNANLINETKIWQAKTNLRLQNEEIAILSLKTLLKNNTLSDKDKFDAHTALAMAYKYSDSIQQVMNHLNKSINITDKLEQSSRNSMILGQLYRQEEKIDSSNYAFQKIISNKKAPFKYQINAAIEQAKNFESTDNVQQMVQTLKDLINDRDNRAYLDKLHYHLGMVYLKNKQMDDAEKQFKKSVGAKNADRFQKVLSYEALGNIHFNKGNYLSSGGYYDSVLNFSSDQNSKRFLKIKRIRKSLDDVILNENLAQTNDSILRLTNMTDDEKRATINTLIERLKSDKNGALKSASLNPTSAKTKESTGKWYFYNPEAVKAGIIEFQKKWGNRSLADNWKLNKYAGLNTVNTEKNTVLDTKLNPEFYLAGIPTDKKQIDNILKVRNEAYYKLGLIYKEQFLRNDLAINRFEKVLSFGENEPFYLPAKYHLYRIYSGTNEQKANQLRNQIIEQNPNSLYATLVQKTGKTMEVSINESTPETAYKKIYLMYENEQYDEVLKHLKEDVLNYSQTDLMPKFELLKAFTIGKMEGASSFKNALEFVAVTYPNSEEGKKAKEVINTIKNNQIK